MGLLTTAQKDAIETNPVYRLVVQIHVPRSSGSSTTDNVKIHDNDGGPHTIIDPGKYDIEGTNQSMGVVGNMTTGMYRIEVDNSGGEFNASVSGSGQYFYNTTGSYAAMPSECNFSRYVDVLIDGAWVELTMVAFSGKIVSVEYDDNNETAVIEVKSHAAAIMDYEFTEDDATEEDTGMNVTWP